LRIADGVAHRLQRLERRGAAVMHEMPTDVQQRMAVAEIGHHMPVPNLVEESCGAHPIVSHCSATARRPRWRRRLEFRQLCLTPGFWATPALPCAESR